MFMDISFVMDVSHGEGHADRNQMFSVYKEIDDFVTTIGGNRGRGATGA